MPQGNRFTRTIEAVGTVLGMREVAKEIDPPILPAAPLAIARESTNDEEQS